MNLSAYLKIVFCAYAVSLPLASHASDSILPEIACRYETKVTPAGKKHVPQNAEAWFFWRKGNLIQTRDADGDQGEIWEKSNNGTIQYLKIYHADKTAVEYMPADQPTNNLNQDWFKLSRMLGEQELGELKLLKKTKSLGRNAELRKGEQDGKSVEVVWLTEEQVPASIVRKDRSGSVELRLVAVAPLAEAQWQPVSLEEIDNYRHIEAVDFGDMENDPFVKKVMKKAGHHH